MSSANAHGATTAPAGKTSQKTSSSRIGMLIVGIIIVGSVLYGIFSPSPSECEAKENPKQQQQPRSPQQNTKTIHIVFGGDYGKVVNIPAGKICNYENATVPYTMKNGDGTEFSSIELEDISDQIGVVAGNKRQQFKGQDGQSGSIDIILTPNN
jgi:hypothetical protein